MRSLFPVSSHGRERERGEREGKREKEGERGTKRGREG